MLKVDGIIHLKRREYVLHISFLLAGNPALRAGNSTHWVEDM